MLRKRSPARKGFTLIELLIVVVIIGILAAIAIPKFANTKEKAYVAAMKSDLRNLATAEESYFNDNNGKYGDASQVGVRGSAGVTLVVTPNTGQGWSAKATHASTTKQCGIYLGNSTVPTLTGGTTPSDTTNGAPFCTY